MDGAVLTENEVNELAATYTKDMFGWELEKRFKISNRLTVTYAYCMTVCVDGGVKLIGFKIASFFVCSGEYSLEAIEGVIKHELIHWYTDVTQGKPCGHNMYFKRNCEIFGVSAKAEEDILKIGEVALEERPRYRLKPEQYHELVCESCGKTIIKGKNLQVLRKVMGSIWIPCPFCSGDSILSKHPSNTYRYKVDNYKKLSEKEMVDIEIKNGVFFERD